jgi:hypothetical protein
VIRRRFTAVRKRAFSRVRGKTIGLIIASLVAGIAAATGFVIHIVELQTQSSAIIFAIFILLAILFSALLYTTLRHFILPRLQPFLPRSALLWVLLSLAVGAFLIVAIPDQLPPEPKYHHLEIVATGQKNPMSKSTELWVIGLFNEDSSQVPTADFKLTGHWEIRDDIPVSAWEQPATLQWDGILRGDGQLKLSRHPLSGIARITWDGQSQLVDLYAKKTPWSSNVFILPLPRQSTETNSTAQDILLGSFYAADAITVGLLLFLGGAWLVTRPQRHIDTATPVVGRWSWLWYAIPCALIWFIYLLAYWPGLMSPDSVKQWQQMVTGHFDDIHPAVHTLTNWLITRVWFSPGAVAIAQIIALSAVFGLTMRELEYWRVPSWVRVIITSLFGLSVVNGMLVITLWTDIAYSIAVLGLFGILLHLVRTHGQWLKSVQGLVIFWLALVCAALYRHNGLAMLAIIPCVLFLGRRQFLGRTLLLGALVLASIFTVIVPFYSAVGVAPIFPSYALETQIHQVGAMVSAGVPLNDEQRMILTSIQPLDSWKQNYNCYGVSPLTNNDDFQHVYFDAHPNQFVSVWEQLAIAHPGILVQHLFCANSVVWSVSQPNWPYVTTYPTGIYANNLGLGTSSMWPWMNQILNAYASFTTLRQNLWWAWRPALYLYVALFCVVIAAIRLRMPRMLLVALPVVLNSLVLLVLSPAADFRFQYSVYMIALIAPALLFASPNAQASANNARIADVDEAAEQAKAQEEIPMATIDAG